MFQKGKTSDLRMKGVLNHLYESPVNILFSFFSLYFYSGVLFGNMKHMCLLQQLFENKWQNSIYFCKQGVVNELNLEKFRHIYHQFLISSWFLELTFRRVDTIGKEMGH